MSFVATENKGFRMKFDNGFSISVQWGTMNYCEKKNLMAEYKAEMKENYIKSTDAEVAVFDSEGGMLAIGDEDSVIGWLGTDDVAKIITIVQSAHPDNEEEGNSVRGGLYEMVEEIKSLKK